MATVADFVAIGEGLAGRALANRLSTYGRHNAALLEAGPINTNPWIQLPSGYDKTVPMNWVFDTELDPQRRVRSDERFYVAGYPVMPTLLPGNINPPALIIGEKASENVLADVAGTPERTQNGKR